MPRRGERTAAVRRVVLFVLIVNLLLVATKLAAWWVSNALSVLAEATQSSLDALNNLMALALARVAARAPDEDHPYGHQKFEMVGALTVVAFLSITVFELIRDAVVRLTAGASPPVAPGPFTLAVIAASAVVALAISIYERRRGRELGSELLIADSEQARGDVLSSVAVLGGLFAVRAGYPAADPLLTLLVAAMVAYFGWGIVKRVVPVLVDERATDAVKIRRIALESEGVQACYRVRSRGRQGQAFAELTIAVAGDLDVQRAHDIADQVERQVSAALGALEVVVHVEPAE